jgi:hypothetical protein
MITDLDLKGTELIVYATIFGFSQDGESRFKGSRQYLAEWCNGTTRSVQTALNSLVEKGLIQKFENTVNNVKLCEYVAIFTPSEKISPPTGEKTSLNNIAIDNIDKDSNFINEITTTKAIEDDCSGKGYSREELRDEFLGSVKKTKTTRRNMRRPTLFDKCVAEIDDYTDKPELRNKLIQFLRIRLEVKDKPFGLASWQGMLEKLDQAVAECGREYVDVVQQSIDKGWLSFYPIDNKSKSSRTNFENVPISLEVSADYDIVGDNHIKSHNKKGEKPSGKSF